MTKMMLGLLRQLWWLALAGALSWWLFLRVPLPFGLAQVAPVQNLQVAVVPSLPAPPPPPEPVADPPQVKPDPPKKPPVQPEQAQAKAPPAPPPPERGAPEGSKDGKAPVAEAAGAGEEPAKAEEANSGPGHKPEAEASGKGATMKDLMGDSKLLESARAELSGKVAKGFATVFLSDPGDQVEIARFFGEELALVPKSALDPAAQNPSWFHLRLGPGEPVVEKVSGRPPLERYRQYRDLFDYEYRLLADGLRKLRLSVLLRSEVYLFAALIPPAEWAAVIGRRREALAQAGRAPADVRRFVIRYVRRPGSTYDIRVEEIVFANGSRFHPDDPSKGF